MNLTMLSESPRPHSGMSRRDFLRVCTLAAAGRKGVVGEGRRGLKAYPLCFDRKQFTLLSKRKG
jgi:hypothetical protein